MLDAITWMVILFYSLLLIFLLLKLMAGISRLVLYQKVVEKACVLVIVEGIPTNDGTSLVCTINLGRWFWENEAAISLRVQQALRLRIRDGLKTYADRAGRAIPTIQVEIAVDFIGPVGFKAEIKGQEIEGQEGGADILGEIKELREQLRKSEQKAEFRSGCASAGFILFLLGAFIYISSMEVSFIWF